MNSRHLFSVILASSSLWTLQFLFLSVFSYFRYFSNSTFCYCFSPTMSIRFQMSFLTIIYPWNCSMNATYSENYSPCVPPDYFAYSADWRSYPSCCGCYCDSLYQCNLHLSSCSATGCGKMPVVWRCFCPEPHFHQRWSFSRYRLVCSSQNWLWTTLLSLTSSKGFSRNCSSRYCPVTWHRRYYHLRMNKSYRTILHRRTWAALY